MNDVSRGHNMQNSLGIDLKAPVIQHSSGNTRHLCSIRQVDSDLPTQCQAQRSVGTEDVTVCGQPIEPCLQLSSQRAKEGIAVRVATFEGDGRRACDRQFVDAMSDVDADADHHRTTVGLSQDPTHLARSCGPIVGWAVDHEVVGPLHRARHTARAQRLRGSNGRHKRQQSRSLLWSCKNRAPQAGCRGALPRSIQAASSGRLLERHDHGSLGSVGAREGEHVSIR